MSWLAFGIGSNFCYISVHEVARGMDPRNCAALPVSHAAITGCDTVSSFSGIGKKTAWKVCQVFPDVIEAFEELLLRKMLVIPRCLY